MDKKTNNFPMFDGEGSSVTSNIKEWETECNKANDNKYFNSFRRQPIFKQVVEGAPIHSGLGNLKSIINNQYFQKTLPKIEKSDLYGNPENLIEFYLNGKKHFLTPTTIRYTKNSLNLINFFSEEIFNYNIFEIGGGYGGEAKIFSDFANQFNSSKEIKWNIFDLPSSYDLIKKWLSIFNYKTNFISIDESFIIPNNSLVISCGAVSEMHGDLLKKYIDNVILPCRYGYFITNFESQSKPYGGITTEEFIKYLKKNGKSDVIELDNRIYLSYFDYLADSKLIVFGMDNNKFKPKLFSRLDNFKFNIIPRLIEKISRINQKLINKFLR